MKLLMTLMLFAGSCPAFADSLFNDDVCPIVESTSVQYSAHLALTPQAFAAFGLRCEDLKTLKNAVTYSSIALMPVSTAMALNPGLQTELMAAGVAVLGSTAVITIGVVGASSVAAAYFILKPTIDECERQDHDTLRDSVMREMQQKYGLIPLNSSVDLEIKN